MVKISDKKKSKSNIGTKTKIIISNPEDFRHIVSGGKQTTRPVYNGDLLAPIDLTSFEEGSTVGLPIPNPSSKPFKKPSQYPVTAPVAPVAPIVPHENPQDLNNSSKKIENAQNSSILSSDRKKLISNALTALKKSTHNYYHDQAHRQFDGAVEDILNQHKNKPTYKLLYNELNSIIEEAKLPGDKLLEIMKKIELNEERKKNTWAKAKEIGATTANTIRKALGIKKKTRNISISPF